MTTINFTAGTVAIVIEKTNNNASVVVPNGAAGTTTIGDDDYVNHTTYNTLDDAYAAAIAIQPDFSGRRIYGGLDFSVDLSDDNQLDDIEYDISDRGTDGAYSAAGVIRKLIAANTNVSYTVTASSGTSGVVFTFQWQKYNTNSNSYEYVPGATSATIAGTITEDRFGTYRCLVKATHAATNRVDEYASKAINFTRTVIAPTTALGYDIDGEYAVTVSGGFFYIDGVQQDSLTLSVGSTYRFDQSDSSNSGHPLRIYDDANKTTQINEGVSFSGGPGTAGAFTQFIPESTGTFSYQCSAHAAMGGDITVS